MRYLIFLLFLTSCISQSKLASLCSSRFPVQLTDSNTVKTIVITVDSTNYDIVNELQKSNDSLLWVKQNIVERIKLVKDSAECADVIESYKGDINHYVEKIKMLSSQVKSSDKISENTTTYVKVKDVAELSVKNNQIEILQSKLNKETIRANDNEIKACLQQKKAIKRLWWLVGLVGMIGIYTAFKFKAILPKFI